MSYTLKGVARIPIANVAFECVGLYGTREFRSPAPAPIYIVPEYPQIEGWLDAICVSDTLINQVLILPVGQTAAASWSSTDTPDGYREYTLVITNIPDTYMNPTPSAINGGEFGPLNMLRFGFFTEDDELYINMELFVATLASIPASGLIVKSNAYSGTNDYIVFTDTTGKYSVDNISGYGGAVNQPHSAAINATLEVFKPDPITKYPTSSSKIFSATDLFYPLLPNISNLPFTINGDKMGYGASSSLPDGIYRLIYTVQFPDPTSEGLFISYTTEQYVMISASIRCCAAKLAAKNIASDCKCGCSGSMSKFEQVWLYIEAAEYCIVCGEYTVASEALQKAIENCGDCVGC